MVYYKSILILMPTSWAVSLAVIITFVIAAFEDKGNTSKLVTNIIRPICYSAIMTGVSFLVYYLTTNSGEYYRWDEQEWWMGDKDDDDYDNWEIPDDDELNFFLSF